MIVITRQVGQALLVGDNISIQVVAIRGDKVRLGIQAPREMSLKPQDSPFPAHPAHEELEDSSGDENA